MTRLTIAALVAIHLAVSVWHGNAHTALDIALPPWKNAFVFLVILIAPVVAASLMWTRYASVGAWTFFLSMLGAIVFGHFGDRIGRRSTLLITIALMGVAGTPVRSRAAEQMLIGQKATSDLFEAAGARAAAELDPPADLHASSAYRRHLAHVLTRRSLAVAAQRAGGSQ